MILRKPYAFLIKHFKLIHLIISLLMFYLITRTNSILNFFKDYIQNNVVEIISSNYINILVYLSLILIIGLIFTMIFLMRKKSKPLLYYILTIILYIILFAGFIYLESTISTLERNILDRKTISLARDITRFMLIGQWLFLIPCVIRTLGFDIKKFDFKKDLQELEVDITDNEEFELVSPIDMNKVEQYGRRRVRELKYYYIENKIFILIIISVIALFTGIRLFNTIRINITTKYEEKEIIELDDYYTLQIEDSYIVSKDKNGKDISTNNNTFLIVKFTVNSKYERSFTLDTNKFLLNIKKDTYIASRRYYDYFTDYGIGYKGQKIKLNDTKTFILVYMIPKDYQNKKMELTYEYRYDYSTNEAKMLKKIIKLEPEIIN